MAPIFAGPAPTAGLLCPLTLPWVMTLPYLLQSTASCWRQRKPRFPSGAGQPAKCGTGEIVCKDASWLLFAQTAPWHQAFYSHLQTLPSLSFVFAKAWDPFSLGSSCWLEMQGAVKEYPSQDPQSLQICWHRDFWGNIVNSLIFSFAKFPCLFLGGGASKAAVLTHQSHLEDWFKHRVPGFMPVFQ